MRWVRLMMALLVACEQSSPELVDEDDVFRRLDVRILSGPEQVIVYIRERDRPCSCENGDFPETGGLCVGSSDVGICECQPAPAFCVRRITLESEGRVLAEYLQGFLPYGQEVYLRVPELQMVAAPYVVVDGCGARAEIPVGGIGPQPSITVSRTPDDLVRVEWMTDRPAASAIASVYTTFYAAHCNVAEQTHDFAGFTSSNSTPLGIGVVGLDLPVSHVTPFGTALVYRAGFAGAELAAPP